MRTLWILGVWSCVDMCARVDAPDTAGQIPTDSSLIDTAAGTDPIPDTKAEYVVIVVMDGARIDETFGTDQITESDAFDQVTEISDLFPTFKSELLPQGTLVRPGYNIGVTITGPGHCSLLTGIRQNFGQFSTPSDPGWYRPELPTIYEALRKTFPDAILKVGGNTDHVHSLGWSIYPGVTGEADGAVYDFLADENDPEKPNDKDEEILSWMQEALGSDAKPKLMLGNMHSMDRAGHYNSSWEAYGERVTQMDEPIVNFWKWIQSDASGVKDKTLMVVVADHGRHRWGDEEAARLEGDDRYTQDFSTHGDQCRGCRELPMFLIGPGIKAGQVLDTPYTLEDVTETLAYAMGTSLPNGDGIVMSEAFVTTPTVANRTGDVRPMVAGGRRAYQRFNEDPWTRSAVFVDDEQLSSEDVVAEEPTLFDTSAGTFACWREFKFDIDSTEVDWPWRASCAQRVGSAWNDIGFPVDNVWPLFTASMAGDGDDLVVAFADNSNATTYSETRGGIRLARYKTTEGNWEIPDGFEGELYPNNPSLVMHNGDPFLAWASSDVTGTSTDAGRYTRHIVVSHVNWDGSEPTYTEVFRTYASGCPEDANCPEQTPSVDAEGFTYDRMEAPAIADLGDGLGVAYIGYGAATGNTILVTSGSDDGSTWTVPTRVDMSGRVFGHINPIWVGSILVWARLTDTDTVEVCRAVAEAPEECVDTGAARIMGLSTDGATVLASLDRGTAEWAVEAVEW